ncbi:MAG: AI-2E family transporter [Acidobacteriota bacterium]|nr:AI-2E family transporter [Acidobacteriota bacterium]
MAESSREGGGPARSLLAAASFVVVVAGLRAAAEILQPLLLAVFIAVLSFPFLEWLRRCGVRTVLAVIATVFADLALLVALGLLISGAVNEFASTAPTYVTQLIEKSKAGLAALEERGFDLSDWVTLEPIDPRQLVDVVGGIVGGTVRGVVSAFSGITLVAVTLVFVLYELVVLPDKLKRALGGADPKRHFESVMREVQRYLGIKTAISVGTGLVIGTWVWFLGVDFPLLWGLAAFLLNYIPVLGPVIAAVPAVLVTLVQFGWGRALVLALGYLVVKVLVGDLLEPHLMGRRFGLSTTVVLVSLMFWGWIWGPLGMILSVPLTMTLKIAFEHSDGMAWAAVLLGPGEPPQPVLVEVGKRSSPPPEPASTSAPDRTV